MNIWIKSSFLLAFILWMSCKSSSRHTPNNYPGIQLVFGRGGGVTGQITTYHLFENGIVFKSTGLIEKTYQKLGKTSSATTTQIFENYQTLDLANIKFNHPGNMYYFVERKQGDKIDKIVWGDAEHEVPKNASLFYSILDHQLTQIKSK